MAVILLFVILLIVFSYGVVRVYWLVIGGLNRNALIKSVELRINLLKSLPSLSLTSVSATRVYS